MTDYQSVFAYNSAIIGNDFTIIDTLKNYCNWNKRNVVMTNYEYCIKKTNLLTLDFWSSNTKHKASGFRFKIVIY